MIAHTACSRLEPVPKLGPPMRMLAPAKRSSLRTKLRSSRHDENRPLPKPVRSTRLSHSAGMIWSVSTSERSSGTAVPWTICTASIKRRSSGRAKWPAMAVAAATAGETRWVRPPRPWRPSKLRLLVDAERSPDGELVGVHGQAHRAARLPPVEAGRGEHLVEPLGLGLVLHGEASPGTTSVRTPAFTWRPSATAAAARRSSMRELVQLPMNTVSTATSRTGRAGGEAHVLEGPGGAVALVGVGEVVGRRDRAVERHDLGRVGAPRDVRARCRRRRGAPPCRRWRRRRWAGCASRRAAASHAAPVGAWVRPSR